MYRIIIAIITIIILLRVIQRFYILFCIFNKVIHPSPSHIQVMQCTWSDCDIEIMYNSFCFRSYHHMLVTISSIRLPYLCTCTGITLQTSMILLIRTAALGRLKHNIQPLFKTNLHIQNGVVS